MSTAMRGKRPSFSSVARLRSTTCEFEDGLPGNAGETLHPLPKQCPHPGSHIGLVEESFCFGQVMPDQIVQIFNLIAQRIVNRLLVEFDRHLEPHGCG